MFLLTELEAELNKIWQSYGIAGDEKGRFLLLCEQPL